MNFLHSIRADLVEKRLLPVVAVLAALVVLVPVGAGLLSGSGSAPPVLGPAPTPTPPPGAPSPAKALAAVAGPTTPAATHYTKHELDPFRLPAGAAQAAAAATGGGGSATAVRVNTSAATPTKTTVKSTPTPSPTKTPATTTPTKPAAPTIPTKPATPTTPAIRPPASTPSPKAQLAKLGARDSYSVDVSVIDATGPHSLNSLVRLSPLPSATNSLIEYLGVLKSGRAAAFLVNPATVVGGPGKCLPRPSNCQVLELKPGQLEVLSVRSSGGPIVQGTVAVTGWRVVTHSSVAAARKVRAQEVKQGQTLVTQSAQPALADVVYSVAQGAVSIIPAIVNALPSTLTKLLGG